MVSTCTYCGTHLLRRWAEYLSLDRSRAPERRLRQVLRAKWLVTVMAIQTEVTEMVVMEMARLVAAALTRCESKQCSWLKKVSMCAKVKEHESETYQCRLDHPPAPQMVRTDTLDTAMDTEESNSNLQKSAKLQKSK